MLEQQARENPHSKRTSRPKRPYQHRLDVDNTDERAGAQAALPARKGRAGKRGPKRGKPDTLRGKEVHWLLGSRLRVCAKTSRFLVLFARTLAR